MSLNNIVKHTFITPKTCPLLAYIMNYYMILIITYIKLCILLIINIFIIGTFY